MKNTACATALTDILKRLIIVGAVVGMVFMAEREFRKYSNGKGPEHKAEIVSKETFLGGNFTVSERGYMLSEISAVITDTKTGTRFLAIHNCGIVRLDEVKLESK